MPLISSSGDYDPHTILKYYDGTEYSDSMYTVTITPTQVTSGWDIRVQVSSTGNAPALRLNIKTGWGISGTDAPPTHFWFADPSFKRTPLGSSGYVNSLWPRIYGGRVWNTETPLSFGPALNVPAIVMDNGTRILGVSHNRQKLNEIYTNIMADDAFGVVSNGNRSYFAGISGATTAFYSVPNDYTTATISEDFTVWIRELEVGAVSTGWALSGIAPYIDWFKTTYPDERPPRISGRVYGRYLSQTAFLGTNIRGYASSGVYTTWDWYDVMDNLIPPISDLRTYGYSHIMFWDAGGSLTGWFPGVQAGSINIFDDMPRNLKNTLYQLDDFAQATGIKVWFWSPGSYGLFQDGNWNTLPQQEMSSSMIYHEGGPHYTVTELTPSTINPTGLTIAKRNMDNGLMAYSFGLGLDACPDPVKLPWITGFLTPLREDSQKFRFAMTESFTTDIGQSKFPSAFFPYTQWDMIRCPFLNEVFPNYQNGVILNWSNIPTDASGGRDNYFQYLVGKIEEEGMLPILLNPYPFASGAFAPSTGVEVGLDKIGVYKNRRTVR